MSSAQQDPKPQRQRKNNVLSEAYEGVTFTRRPSSGRPGTPHSYFEASYNVHFATMATPNDPDNSASVAQPQAQQVVHTHVNGLVVVTAGESFSPPSEAPAASKTLQRIDVVAHVADVAHQGAGKKRKRQSQMLQRAKRGPKTKGPDSNNTSQDFAIYPTDVLVTLSVEDTSQRLPGSTEKEEEDTVNHNTTTTITASSSSTSIPLQCCVYGSILEINSRIVQNPQILQDDPLLDGYLAIVLPSGPFPPPSNIQEKIANQQRNCINDGI